MRMREIIILEKKVLLVAIISCIVQINFENTKTELY